jgi:hypothetical protein
MVAIHNGDIGMVHQCKEGFGQVGKIARVRGDIHLQPTVCGDEIWGASISRLVAPTAYM